MAVSTTGLTARGDGATDVAASVAESGGDAALVRVPVPRHRARDAPVVPFSVLQGDATVCQLAVLRQGLAVPLSRAAATLVEHGVWLACGFRRREDFAREQLQRPARWLRQLQRLDQVLGRFPALATALCGADGGVPLGRTAALLIGRVATAEDLGAWITQARRSTVVELHAAVAAHVEGEEKAGATRAASARAALEADTTAADRVSWALEMPPELHVAEDGMLDFFATVVGCEAGVAAFADAVAGEASSGLWPPPEEYRPRFRGGAGSAAAAESASTSVRKQAAAPLQSSVRPAVVIDRASPIQCQAQRVLEDFERLRGRHARLVEKLAARGRREPQGTSEGAAVGVRRPRLCFSRTRVRDLKRLLRVFMGLIRMEDRLECEMGSLLLDLHERRAWRLLGYAGLAAYAEARLDLGGSTARTRVELARALQRLPAVRRAYLDGLLGVERVRWLVRAVREGRVEASEHGRWIEHARSTTLKRLRDEARLLRRDVWLRRAAVAQSFTPGRRVEEPGFGLTVDAGTGSPAGTETGSRVDTETARRSPLAENAGPTGAAGTARHSPLDAHTETARRSPPLSIAGRRVVLAWRRDPIDDATWRASLLCVPAKTREWLIGLGHALVERVARGGPVLLTTRVLSLPSEIATALAGCTEAARRDLAHRATLAVSPAEEARLPPSERMARYFVGRGRRLPSWVGYWALLEESAWEWDAPQGRKRYRTFERDGYRCMAPACTTRMHLHEHHLCYRSQGGDDEPENLWTLCVFHHLQGEHGTLARCRGRAPLDVVFRLGCDGLEHAYRNERLLR